MGNGFSIDGNNYLASFLNQLNKKGAKPINYVSNPNKPQVESTGDVDYKELLGATFSTGNQTDAVFTDADLQGLTDMAMTDTMATTVSGIEAMADADFDIDELDRLVIPRCCIPKRNSIIFGRKKRCKMKKSNRGSTFLLLFDVSVAKADLFNLLYSLWCFFKHIYH